jgi:hypothetical protein
MRISSNHIPSPLGQGPRLWKEVCREGNIEFQFDILWDQLYPMLGWNNISEYLSTTISEAPHHRIGFCRFQSQTPVSWKWISTIELSLDQLHHYRILAVECHGEQRQVAFEPKNPFLMMRPCTRFRHIAVMKRSETLSITREVRYIQSLKAGLSMFLFWVGFEAGLLSK